jgi:hypothetical protein
VIIVVTVLAVHGEDVIPVGGVFPVEDDGSEEDVVAVLIGATVVLLLVEVLLVVVLLVIKASSWYISKAFTPPQSSRGAPWQT